MKLLELCCSPSKGGLELYFANISNELQSHFDLVNVVAVDSAVCNLLEENRPVLTIHKKVHYFPLLSAIKLSKLIDEYGVDVLHLHWNKDLTVAVFAKLFSQRKPKIVLTRHMQFPSKKDGMLHRFLYKNINHIIAVTNTMAHDLTRFIPEEVRPEISVNYLGIDTIEHASAEVIAEKRATYDPMQQLFLIGLFGRIDPYKGHDLFIDALIQAKVENKPFKGLIVGHPMDESYLDALKQRVLDNQLEEYVVFTGFVDNPRALMQACDTVILATVEETFGLVLIEAMSVGVPVIGSNRGGVPEIIDHQKTGLLFESEDSGALYQALDSMYQNPEQAKLFASHALETVSSKFSGKGHLDRLVSQLQAVHER